MSFMLDLDGKPSISVHVDVDATLGEDGGGYRPPCIRAKADGETPVLAHSPDFGRICPCDAAR
jgi:hypothetical protein